MKLFSYKKDVSLSKMKDKLADASGLAVMGSGVDEE
jgi:hypothetical protein